MQLFGHEFEQYFQLQWPEKGVQNPFGVTFQGGKTSSLGQKPQFHIIEIDYTQFMPRKITTYEFDIDKANADPNAKATDLIKQKSVLPTTGMTSLRPQDVYAYITKVNSTESTAIAFKK